MSNILLNAIDKAIGISSEAGTIHIRRLGLKQYGIKRFSSNGDLISSENIETQKRFSSDTAVNDLINRVVSFIKSGQTLSVGEMSESSWVEFGLIKSVANSTRKSVGKLCEEVGCNLSDNIIIAYGPKNHEFWSFNSDKQLYDIVENWLRNNYAKQDKDLLRYAERYLAHFSARFSEDGIMSTEEIVDILPDNSDVAVFSDEITNTEDVVMTIDGGDLDEEIAEACDSGYKEDTKKFSKLDVKKPGWYVLRELYGEPGESIDYYIEQGPFSQRIDAQDAQKKIQSSDERHNFTVAFVNKNGEVDTKKFSEKLNDSEIKNKIISYLAENTGASASLLSRLNGLSKIGPILGEIEKDRSVTDDEFRKFDEWSIELLNFQK